jgi:hypothetical protein
MSIALAPILIGVATKVGAPVVKSILENYVGGAAGDIGGKIIDAIAGTAGVKPEELPDLPEAELEAAVRTVEAESPELLIQWNIQQKQTHDLFRAEMDKGPFWSWAWRPGGMYLIGLFWVLYVIVYPLLNLFLRLWGSSAALETMVDVATLLAISGGFISLYMGGHTVLRGIKDWKGK